MTREIMFSRNYVTKLPRGGARFCAEDASLETPLRSYVVTVGAGGLNVNARSQLHKTPPRMRRVCGLHSQLRAPIHERTTPANCVRNYVKPFTFEARTRFTSATTSTVRVERRLRSCGLPFNFPVQFLGIECCTNVEPLATTGCSCGTDLFYHLFECSRKILRCFVRIPRGLALKSQLHSLLLRSCEHWMMEYETPRH
jgi:hypothetical protein